MEGVGLVMSGRLELRIGEATFKNPVFLASGPAGYGLEYCDFIDLKSLGGVVTKTITLNPAAGNAGRRLQETGSGLLNSIGLENVGVKKFFREKFPPLIENNVGTIVSVGAGDWRDYEEILRITASEDRVKVVELNLSCPNVERGGMAVGLDPELVKKYVERAVTLLEGRKVIAKLTPNVTDIGDLAVAACDGGADAITAINTVTGMDIDCEREEPVFRRVTAGLSGPAILPVALYAVWRISHIVDIPVMGVGGISSVEDARKFFMAGASAVQVGTAIFYQPELPEMIVRNLEDEGLPEKVSAVK